VVKDRDKWVHVTTAWHVLRFRLQKRPPIWMVAANILNKQSRTAKKRWSSSFGVKRGADNSSSLKMTHVPQKWINSWYYLNNGKET